MLFFIHYNCVFALFLFTFGLFSLDLVVTRSSRLRQWRRYYRLMYMIPGGHTGRRGDRPRLCASPCYCGHPTHPTRTSNPTHPSVGSVLHSSHHAVSNPSHAVCLMARHWVLDLLTVCLDLPPMVSNNYWKIPLGSNYRHVNSVESNHELTSIGLPSINTGLQTIIFINKLYEAASIVCRF